MLKIKDFRQISFFIGFIAVILYNLNYIVLGEDSYITIDDNIDDLIPTFKMLRDTGLFFKPDAIVPVADGFKRSLFNSPFDPTLWLYMILPAYWATVIQIFICKIVAFVSMFYLLRGIFKGIEETSIPLVVSFGFTIIPFYYIHGLGVAGTPMVALAFLWLYRHERIILSYILLVIYSVYTYFPLLGVFSCIVSGVGLILISILEKRAHKEMIIGFTIMVIVYIACNWALISGFLLGNDVIYQRAEFHSNKSIVEYFKQVAGYFLYGQMHAGSFLPCIAVVIVFLLTLKNGFKDRVLNLFMAGFISIGVIALMANVFKPYSSLLNTFQFDRFYFFIPILCFISFAYVLHKSCSPLRKFIFYSLFLLMSVSGFQFDSEHKYVVRKLIGAFNENSSYITFGEFFDTKLFDEIKIDLLKEKNTKVCAFGLHPNILMFNGIHTVDFYHNIYPLEYKHKFRKVIANEIEKDPNLLAYFDNWGNRCYLFSSELGLNYLYGKNNAVREVNNLEINTNALKDLGCSYIISAVRINNAKQLDLEYVNMYTTPESFWELYVYRL